MRARNGVCAKHNPEPWSTHRVLDDLMVRRKDLVHRCKSFRRVALRAEILVFVEDIVLDNQSALWIEVRSLHRQKLQVVVRSQRAMLHLRASCDGSSTHR